MSTECSQGQHQGAGLFCTRCEQRIPVGGIDTPPPAPKARRTKPFLIGCGGIVAFFVVAGILGALFGESTQEDTGLNYTQEDTELTYFEDGYATMLEAYLSDQRDISSECLLARSLSEKQCSKRYASLVECKDANYSTTKSRLL